MVPFWVLIDACNLMACPIHNIRLGAAGLFRVISCGWNKQLCRYHQNTHPRKNHPLWKDEYQCLGDTWSLAHGNCDGNDKIMAVSKAPSLCQAQGLEWTLCVNP